METISAVARMEGGKVTVWASTQTPFPLQQQVAQALAMPKEDVRVIAPYVGGGFGGKSASAAGHRSGAPRQDRSAGPSRW